MNPEMYSYNEKCLIVIITLLSHLSMVPMVTLLALKKLPIEFIFGFASIFFSFMYHLLEYIEMDIVLDSEKWHELDNIGAITGLLGLILEFLNESRNFRTSVKMIGHTCTLIFQKLGPWQIQNTIMPIVLGAIFLITNLLVKGAPKINRIALGKGIVLLVFAIFFFVLGLDDGNDYLRLYHNLWHAFLGFSGVYLWQVQDEKCLSPWESICSTSVVVEELFGDKEI